MGVSGCGKSEVGRRVAALLGVAFLDADDLHSAENVRKMRAGTPLTDDDRGPWLDAVAREAAAAEDSGAGLVIACSALKRRHRSRLRSAAPTLRLVHLSGSIDVIFSRLAARTGHFMPASLLESQVATLEPPMADEWPIVIDVTPPADEIAARVIEALAPLEEGRAFRPS